MIPRVGMKRKDLQMNSSQVTTVLKHIAAVGKLLLNDKVLKPSLTILGGEELSPLDRINYGRAAVEDNLDLIYLSFAIDDAGEAVMTEITVFLPRDLICYSWTNCRLALLPGRTCAVLDPQANMSGHFRVTPGEIVQEKGKPKALVKGAERAAKRLAMLVRDGVDLTGQVVLNAFVPA